MNRKEQILKRINEIMAQKTHSNFDAKKEAKAKKNSKKKAR